MKLLKYQNVKLRDQFIFTLPASKEVCGRQCPGCYSLREQIRFPTSVVLAREARYKASLSDTFTSDIIKEINGIRKPFKAIRLHASGEFYSQDYIDKWVSIATQLPSIQFYAFTKRLKDFDFTALMALSNVVIINSLAFGGLNYAPLAKLDQSKPICPDTLGKAQCGISCSYCWTKEAQHNGIQFVQH